jgi:biotin synthase-related radical SAM superfamily protein
MVDHEIDGQVEILTDFFHILPGAKGGVHLIVGQGREAAVGGGGIEGQQVDPPM